ncbi:hypothetical protein KL86PLE_41299 [uncultured Pleomorphomonas sp.]|uniref:Uncharacterized protein n=1 Tax=uncultured Pleomorphomonas sp. TaxID=442121 RepID=A0A212LIY2_9HYPH|nr:hypothetical protein KL86PLE_41299 [uncultured Pleomorphomonas sp.]
MAVAFPQPGDRLVPPGFRPDAMQHLRRAVDRGAIGVGAFADRQEALRAGDVDDPPAAGVDQAADGQPGALLVVGAERYPVGRPFREGVDHRHGEARKIDRQLPVEALAGSDDAVDALVQHGVDVDARSLRIVLDGAQEHRHAMPHQFLRYAGHHRQGEAAVGVVGEQADGEAALGDQAARQRVRPEADLLRYPLHPLPRLRAHPSAAVERLGGGRDRHARQCRHGVDSQPSTLATDEAQFFLPCPLSMKKPFLLGEVNMGKHFLRSRHGEGLLLNRQAAMYLTMLDFTYPCRLDGKHRAAATGRRLD